MARKGKPRRGSLQFSPRKRAKSAVPRVRRWPDGDGMLGFTGYKVGMATAMVTTDNSDSPLVGKKQSKAATIIEVPPMVLKGIRVYRKTEHGDEVVGDYQDPAKAKEGDYARLMLETQPDKAGLPAKKPAVVETGFGGTLEEAKEFAKDRVGKDVRFSEVFKSGDLVDVIAVTKGKGLQGPVRRFGVKLLGHKTEKSARKPGSLGPWTPKRTPWQVPMAGQHGYHARTEHNKQLLAVGEGGDVNPKSGWHRYGLVKSDYVAVLGSVPGPAKRPVRIRAASRPSGGESYELQELIVNGEVKKQ